MSKVLKPTEHQQKPKSIQEIIRKELENNEIKNELNEIKNIEEEIDRNDVKYKTNQYTFDFQQFQTTRFLGDSIFSGKTTISEVDKK